MNKNTRRRKESEPVCKDGHSVSIKKNLEMKVFKNTAPDGSKSSITRFNVLDEAGRRYRRGDMAGAKQSREN